MCRQGRIWQFANVVSNPTKTHVLFTHRHNTTNIIVGPVIEHYTGIRFTDEMWYRE